MVAVILGTLLDLANGLIERVQSRTQGAAR